MKIQFCSFIMNLFQPYKMCFFRWKKNSNIFEYNLDKDYITPSKKRIFEKKFNFLLRKKKKTQTFLILEIYQMFIIFFFLKQICYL